MSARSKLATAVAVLAFAAPLFALGTVPARAQSCGPHAAVKAHLQKRFKENRDARGLSSDGRLVEVYVAPGGSWTIVVSFPNGLSCILAAGEAWQNNLYVATEPSA